MSQIRAAGPCRDCGHHTNAGLVVAEVQQGSGGGGCVVVCPACEADPATAALKLRVRMREARRYPEGRGA